MPSYLGNFSNIKTFGEFPKYQDIWGIPQVSSNLGYFKNLKNKPPLKFLQEIGKTGEFTKYLGFWGIPQIPGNLGNFQNSRKSGKFPKFLGESEGGLFFNHRKFLQCLAIWEISQ